MSNPWLKKNPFMSLWLSGANRIGNTVRGKLAGEARRTATAAVNKATRDAFGLWTGAMGAAAKPARRKKR